jgi:thiamine-monophosphate kinase
MPSEFDLIAKYFTRPSVSALLGVGDDAALMRPTPGYELAVSTDMLVAGQHFFADTDPYWLGHKTLAVNLSDLAAMGATPRWALLALSLPQADADWLQAFSRGLFDLAERHGVELVGGDTTRGPLNICLTILGEVEAGRALRRDGAKAGDEIWVSGELGGAALGLLHLRGEIGLSDDHAEACLHRLHVPEPRNALGTALLGIANAAIDISDGLLADLGHILERSGVGAAIEYARLPAAPAIALWRDQTVARHCQLAGGDDYELCFTAPVARRAEVLLAAKQTGVPVTSIGTVTPQPGLRVLGQSGESIAVEGKGFDHFAT